MDAKIPVITVEIGEPRSFRQVRLPSVPKFLNAYVCSSALFSGSRSRSSATDGFVLFCNDTVVSQCRLLLSLK